HVEALVAVGVEDAARDARVRVVAQRWRRRVEAAWPDDHEPEGGHCGEPEEDSGEPETGGQRHVAAPCSCTARRSGISSSTPPTSAAPLIINATGAPISFSKCSNRKVTSMTNASTMPASR